MKAIRIHQAGGPDVLRLEELPLPEPGPGQARVKVEAAGVNFADVYQRQGVYHGALPAIAGREAAGVVDALGPEVTEVSRGDRVGFVGARGSYAEYVVVQARTLAPIPVGVSTRQAAAVLLQGMTAHYLTRDTYPLAAGKTALVHAAAGGVGALLVQTSKLRGARVIGTVSTEEKAAIARAAGADEVILYTLVDFEEETKRLTGGAGVEVVYDSVGRVTFEKSLNCLKPLGYMVLYGQSSGPVPPIDPQVLNFKGSLFLTRPSLSHYTANRQALLARANDVFAWLQQGKLDLRIDREFPLAEAAAAHRYMEERKSKGKVLLIP